MANLYHAVPRIMTGTMLYPLNQLREIDTELYETQARKYRGRERLMQRRIPLLGNCLWNDVLFLTAVHPEVFHTAFAAAGFTRQPFRSFQFPVDTVDPSRTVVFSSMRENKPVTYEPFDVSRMDEYGTIPQETLKYWQQEREAGNEWPFLYLHIPHILYRGTLDTTTIPIVESKPRAP